MQSAVYCLHALLLRLLDAHIVELIYMSSFCSGDPGCEWAVVMETEIGCPIVISGFDFGGGWK